MFEVGMMKKQYRIKNSDEIETVMKKGFSKANPFFILYKYQNPTNHHFRMAISAPKKLGNAVVRNKMKRRIRASIQANQKLFHPNCDYFIIAREKCLDINFEAFNQNIIEICKRVNHPKSNTNKSKQRSFVKK